METLISDKIYIKNPTQKVYLWCVDNLRVKNPTYMTLMKLGKEDTIRWRHVPECINLFIENGFDLVVPFGCLKGLWQYIKEGTYTLDFNNSGTIAFPNEKATVPTRDYQEKAIEAMVNAKGGVLIGPCSCGKTNIGIEIVHRIGKKFLWVAHTLDLIKQSRTRMKQLYPNMDIGLISEGNINMGRDGTCATIQTLSMIDKDIYKNEFECVIVDECHHCVADAASMKLFAKVVGSINARYKYGITATGKRSDSLTPAIYAILGANNEGKLAPTYEIPRSAIKVLTAKHIRIDVDTPFEYAMLNEDGTFNYSKMIDLLSHNEDRNKAIVEKVCELNKEGRKQLILCNRVEHCETLYKLIKDRGLNIELVVGKSGKKQRKKCFENERNWSILISTYSLAREGLDLPELDTLVLASIIKDEIGVTQSAGRIERLCENKKEPIVIDVVDKNIPYAVGAYKKRARILRNRR